MADQEKPQGGSILDELMENNVEQVDYRVTGVDRVSTAQAPGAGNVVEFPAPLRQSAIEEPQETVKRPSDEGAPLPAISPSESAALAARAYAEGCKRQLSAYIHSDGLYRTALYAKVMADEGDAIRFFRTDESATKACVALALQKGWTAVEIGGTPERKERAWVEYMLAGISVTNYSPPQHVMERYQRLLAAAGGAPEPVDRQAGPARMKA